MRRSRRNGHSGMEFGGSGEDSFVAVVVTKLTGALLFILLLTMVIMALLPKATDLPPSEADAAGVERPPLAIATPEVLPEAIAGHPYVVALAATGGRGPLQWSVDGPLPVGLAFDPTSGQLRGTPHAGTPTPAELVLRVSDGQDRTAQPARLVVYQSDRPLTTPSKWKPGIPPVPYRAWLEHGFGFLVIALVHMVGMNSIASMRRWSLLSLPADSDDADQRDAERRFVLYRSLIRVASLTAAIALAVWLWQQQSA